MSDLMPSTVSVSAGSSSAILPPSNRTVGSAMAAAAIAAPVTPRTAMPSATTPRSPSEIAVPNPCRWVAASCRLSALSAAASSASSGCSRTTSSNGRSARSTLPPEQSRAASRIPTRLPTRSALLVSTVSMNWMSAPTRIIRLLDSPTFSVNRVRCGRAIPSSAVVELNAPPPRSASALPTRYVRSSACSTKPRNRSMEMRRCAVDFATPSSAAAPLTRSMPSRFSISNS
jgi:hypothetical protein